MNPVELLFQSYDQGNRFVVLRGRSLSDLTVNNNGQITSILEILRNEAFKNNKILLTYSKSEGLNYDSSGLSPTEAQDVDNVLRQFNLPSMRNSCNSQNEDEFSSFIRGLLKLVQSSEYPKFRNGEPMAFMIIVLYAENNCPEMQAGFHSENQLVAIELASTLSRSLGLRKSGCFVLFCEEKEGSLDTILTRDVKVVRLPQPDIEEKEVFLDACEHRYPSAQFEEGLLREAIINITVNTPNRSLEKLYYASDTLKTEITPSDVFEKKQSDIIQISEGTLSAVDYERIKYHKLVGRNIRRAIEIAMIVANAIKIGSKTALRNIMFCGSPSTGKTDLVTCAAYSSDIQSFMLHIPKRGIVGESERLTTRQINCMKEQHGIGIIDELELTFPMNRNIESGDGGVTQNLMGQFQSFLSDSSLSGKVALFATSNRPGAISDAMKSRWIIVPVLMALKKDYPSILWNISKGINPELTLNENDQVIIDAAENFYYSGASPREMRESIVASLAMIPGNLSSEHIAFACQDKIPTGVRTSYIHSDLVAISLCSNNSFLPWWDVDNNRPDLDYPYPDYISEILDDSHRINREKLERKIRELEPYANV